MEDNNITTFPCFIVSVNALYLESHLKSMPTQAFPGVPFKSSLLICYQSVVVSSIKCQFSVLYTPKETH